MAASLRARFAALRSLGSGGVPRYCCEGTNLTHITERIVLMQVCMFVCACSSLCGTLSSFRNWPRIPLSGPRPVQRDVLPVSVNTAQLLSRVQRLTITSCTNTTPTTMHPFMYVSGHTHTPTLTPI